MTRRLAVASAVALLLGLVWFSSPARATFPGSNGRIAFFDYTTQQIYAINPDGTGLQQLTNAPAGKTAADPNWSPDGTHLAFSTDLSGDPRLYVMNSDGSGQQLVFDDQAGYRDLTPRYTPDGSSLAFSRCKPDDGVCAIWEVGVDGTNLHGLTTFKEGRKEAVDFDPAVSPDGQHIAFARFGAHGIIDQLFVMDADGTNQHAVTPPRLEASNQSWSPDGQRIAFASNCCRLNSQIWTIRPDGRGLSRLTTTGFPNNDVSPVFSPAGDMVAFASDRNYPDICCLDLFMANADGTGQHKVDTGTLNHIVQVTWGTAPLVSPSATPSPPIMAGDSSAAPREAGPPWRGSLSEEFFPAGH